MRNRLPAFLLKKKIRLYMGLKNTNKERTCLIGMNYQDYTLKQKMYRRYTPRSFATSQHKTHLSQLLTFGIQLIQTQSKRSSRNSQKT